jgi:hypothetical protein
MSSQSTFEDTKKIQTVVINGDTLIQMPLSSAKIILQSVLENEIADSLLIALSAKDSINTNIIEMQISTIRLLQEKSNNQEQLNQNLNLIIQNKDLEIEMLNEIIRKQKRYIRKQKLIKTVSLVGNIVLPIAVLIATTLGG